MEKAKAKKICLEVWRHLRDNPEIEFKSDLPKKLYNKIKNMSANCPLCEYCRSGCHGCPLDIGDYCFCFKEWSDAMTKKARARYANRIVEAVEKW